MIIIVNRSNSSKTITLDSEKGRYKDKFSKEEFYCDGSITLVVERENYKILTK